MGTKTNQYPGQKQKMIEALELLGEVRQADNMKWFIPKLEKAAGVELERKPAITSDGLKYTTYDLDKTAEKNNGIKGLAQKITTAAETLRNDKKATGPMKFEIHQRIIQEANLSLSKLRKNTYHYLYFARSSSLIIPIPLLPSNTKQWPTSLRLPLNNKSGPLHVPGLHGLPINVLLPHDQFTTGVNSWRAPLLTAKELAILRLINAITDRPGWHCAIFDQHVTAQWREEAVASASLINDKT
ncbi:hypothetical protein BDV10DRAFT_190137 [Aspergillus recurvatus]